MQFPVVTISITAFNNLEASFNKDGIPTLVKCCYVEYTQNIFQVTGIIYALCSFWLTSA